MSSIQSHGVTLPPVTNFQGAFELYREMILEKSGFPFQNFNQGHPLEYEGYKLPLRLQARERLAAEPWSEDAIGSGSILKDLINAIEIPEDAHGPANNLVSWDNRWGHASRDHRRLLEAEADPDLAEDIEGELYRLYRGERMDEPAVFERLMELAGARYRLLAYLFFLKDETRFMPVHPTGFDKSFEILGIDFRTMGNCSWENYTTFNFILDDIRRSLSEDAQVPNVRLIDAHSFCWDLVNLTRQKTQGQFGELAKSKGRKKGYSLSGVDKAAARMAYSILDTARQSGKAVTTIRKTKRVSLDGEQLKEAMNEKMRVQGYKCVLTGIPLHFDDEPGSDPQRYPSPDRMKSDGHYYLDNIQVVCRFVNFWKGAQSDEEFLRLLRLVQGHEEDM